MSIDDLSSRSEDEPEPEGILDYEDGLYPSGDELIVIHVKIPRRMLDEIDSLEYKEVNGIPTKISERSTIVRELLSEALKRREQK